MGPVELKSGPVPVPRNNILKRIGSALVGSSLIILVVIGSVPFLNVPSVRVVSFFLAVGGFLTLIVNGLRRSILSAGLRRRAVYCTSCGWKGLGEDVLRLECCPECEGNRGLQWLGR